MDAPEDQPSLPELLRFLSERRRTCVVHVSDGQCEGELCLLRGEVTYAEFGGAVGATALLTVLTEERLQYRLDAGERTRTRAALPAPLLESAPASAPSVSLTGELAAFEDEEEHTLPGVEPSPIASVERGRLEVVDDSDHPGHVRDVGEELGVHDAPALEAATEAPAHAIAGREPGSTSEPELELVREAAGEVAGERPTADEPSPPDEPARCEEPAPLDEAGQREEPSQLHEPAPASVMVEPLTSITPPPPRRLAGSWLWAAAALIAFIGLLAVASRPTSGSNARAVAASKVAPSNAPATLLSRQPPLLAAGALIPTVVVRAEVKSDGHVGRLEIQGSRPDLREHEQRALAAVRASQFKAAMKDGKPVTSWLTLPVRFSTVPGSRLITIKGSETLGSELAPAWTRAFEGKSRLVRVAVESLGSATGFAGLLDGSAQIAIASRRISDRELAAASKLGLQLRELVAGHDAVAVIAHRDNPIRQLDREALARVFAQRVASWGELGGADAPIRVYGRPSYSGTHAFFREEVFGASGPDATFGPSVESVEASSELVARVAKDRAAIGYVSLSHVDETVQVLAIAPALGRPAVRPTVASVQDGTYPLARPLLIYLPRGSGAEASAFVDFALSLEGQRLVQKSGFVPLTSTFSLPLAEEADGATAPKLSVTRIYFEPASTALSHDSRLDLLASAAAMRSGRGALVIGNADASGDAERNRAIAEKRARMVAAQLQRYAAKQVSIDVIVASSERPLATNDTDEGRRANRRVDVVLVDR